MTELITAIVPYISPAAFPTVVVVIACWFIYWKINSQRKDTKKERDADSEQMKTRIALLENEIQQIKRLDLETKLAQIQTDLQWIKENLKK